MKINNDSAGRTLDGARMILLCAGLACSGPAVLLGGEPAPVVEEPAVEEPPTNWIEFGVGYADVSGDEAAFQRRHQINGDFYGGISSFHYENMGDSGILTIDGHAMFGLEDYELEIDYTNDDWGFIRGGYRQFRTWYDGSGGWAGPGVPPPNDWIQYYGDDLELDRGEIWIEAGLRMENIPAITFGYSHSWRDGQKDSTIWGRATRGNIPSLYDLDETTDIFRLDIEHTLGNTDLGGGLRYQSISNDDTLYTRQGGPNASATSDRRVTDYQPYDADLFNAHLFSESRFCDEQMLLSFGYSFTSMDTDINTGFRSSYDRNGDLRTSQDHSYFNLNGGSQVTLHVANANFWWNPVEDLVVVPSLRGEWRDQQSWGGHDAGIRGMPDGTLEEVLDNSNYGWDELTGALEVRYTGIDNTVLYAKAEASQADVDMWRFTEVEGEVDASRTTTSDIEQEKYTVGMNWYPTGCLTLAAQGYYRNYDRGFEHLLLGDDAQLIYHGFDTTDANLRLTWKPFSKLTLVSRYDYQQTDIQNQAIGPAGLTYRIDSADITKHIFTESATWSPIDRMYLQGSFAYIMSETDTPADAALAPGVITDWDNDYWSVSLNAGYLLTASTTLTAGYYYYHADNYVYNSPVTMPYGTIADEHVFSIRLDQRIGSNMTWNIGYGYYKGEDDAYAGLNDYEAHVISTGFRFAF